MQEETKRISLHAPKKLKLSLSVLGEFMIDIFRFHWKELGGGGRSGTIQSFEHWISYKKVHTSRFHRKTSKIL